MRGSCTPHLLSVNRTDPCEPDQADIVSACGVVGTISEISSRSDEDHPPAPASATFRPHAARAS